MNLKDKAYITVLGDSQFSSEVKEAIKLQSKSFLSP